METQVGVDDVGRVLLFRPGRPVGAAIAVGRGVDQRQSLGKRGEDLACQELKRRGYAILDRRFRTRCGELDIVAKDGNVFVFVEVKARSGCRFGTPFESLTWQKRQRLSSMAESYLFLKRLSGVACRFDVVSILESPDGCTIELIRGAFELASRHR
jgi:putative endonuclease